MDGRVQLPIIEWMKKNYELDYIDMITEPGPDKIMSNIEDKRVELIKSKAEISVNAHDSKFIVIAGHHDCAGNPLSKEMHIEQIKKPVGVIKSWKLQPVDKIIGVWVNENWQVELIP